MAGRSATVANRNWEEWGPFSPPHRTALARSIRFYPRLAKPLTTKPLRSTRISLVGNCDRFLHTYRIPQAVPRILGIPDRKSGVPAEEKTEESSGEGKGERETTKTKGPADKKFLHGYSAHSESRRECEQRCYIEYLFSLRPERFSGYKWNCYSFFFELLYYFSKYII